MKLKLKKKKAKIPWVEQSEQDRTGIARVIAEHRYDVETRRDEHLRQKSYPIDQILVQSFEQRIRACGVALELLGEPDMVYLPAVHWSYVRGGE